MADQRHPHGATGGPGAAALVPLVLGAGLVALDQVLDAAVVKRGVLALLALVLVGPLLAWRARDAAGAWSSCAGARLWAAATGLGLVGAFVVWPQAEVADRLAGFALLQLTALAGLAVAESAPRLLPLSVLAAAAVAALVAFAQALGLERALTAGTGEVVALAGNTNRAGALAALGTVVALAAVLAGRRPLPALLLLALLAGSLLLTRSRGAAWFAAPAGLGAVVAARLLGARAPGEGGPPPVAPARRLLLAGVALAVAVVLGAVAGGPGTLAARKLTDQQGQQAPFGAADTTTSVRLALWRSTARMVADHPWLGVGLGRFASAFPPYRDPGEAALPGREGAATAAEHPHQELLLVAAEAGLPAAALMALFLAWTLMRAVRLALGDPGPAPLAVLGVLVSGSVLACGQDAWSDPSSAVPFFAAAGFAWAPRPDEARAWRPFGGAWSALPLALALGAALLALPRLHAHLLFRSSLLRASEAGTITSDSFELLARAADAAPGDVALQRWLAVTASLWAPRAPDTAERVAAVQAVERARARIARLAPHDHAAPGQP